MTNTSVKDIEEPARKLPVLAETDVLVVGGGPAGLAAALAAAREGVATMLIERWGFLGGNITTAMVESIAWYRHEKTIDAGGIGCEFESRTVAFGGAQKDPRALGQLLDADMFKVVADQMVEEAGVTPLLHCAAVGVIKEGDRLVGVITESKSGRQVILAKTVIDASGDADIAHHAGVPYRKGDEDGSLMPVTMNFGMSGVDVARFKQYQKDNPVKTSEWAKQGENQNLLDTHLSEPFKKAKAAGEIPADIRMGGAMHTLTEAGEANDINVTRLGGIDGTDVWDTTKAEIEGRRHVMMAVAALRKYTPGFENAKLRTFAPFIGLRETRKIIGEYVLTGDEIQNEARFDDSIGIFPEFLDAYGIVTIPTTGRYFQVPFGILLPQGVDNLLVAGRCVSGDKVSHAATRQMMCCAVTGQGAGVAAAQAVKDGVGFRALDITRVQKALEKQGVRVR